MVNTSKKIYVKIALIFSILLIITLTLFNMFEINNYNNELIANAYNDSYNGSTKLSSLYVKNHEGDINFDSDTYTYSLNIFSSLKSVEVVATPKNSEATVTITGNKYLSTNGAITITVSNGGSSTTYTINYTCTKTDVVTNFSLAKYGQDYPINNTGIYKLEVWGAAGGYRYTSSYGFGGYSVGFYNGVLGDTLYAFTGYRGSNFVIGNGNYSYGGYNGGGTGGTGNQGGSGGGGASHIAINLKKDNLAGYINNKDNVLIVAGGGGGGADDVRHNDTQQNGSGGGYQGNKGGWSGTYPQYHATGGSQTAGGNDNAEPSTQSLGKFGQGGSYVPETCGGGSKHCGGQGGGGGWYGGGGSSRAHSGAGGGSGYIGNSLLIDYNGTSKHMTCYYCATSNTANIRTITSVASNSTATADIPKLGDGAVRITRVAPISNDNFLSNITTDKGTWNQSFKPEESNYKVTADMYDDSITINVIKSSSNAAMVGDTGTFNLNLGYNYFTYTLTAVNGEVRTYNVTVIRGSLKGKHTSEAYKITSLTNGDMIYVKKNIFNYNIPLIKGQVALDLLVEPYDPEATVEIYDNDLVGDGDLIKIKISAPGCADSIYLLTVQQQDKSSYVVTKEYTGKGGSWTAPLDGLYQIEVWGAQGGTYGAGLGGYGGYSTGIIEAQKNDTYYYTIGGIGQPCTSGYCSTSGGYNGGGNAWYDNQPTSGGGGATHFAKELYGSGLLKDYSSHKEDVVIVAGGGGGGGIYSNYYGLGGAGGGYQGQMPYSSNSIWSDGFSGLGGTQSDGGITYYNGRQPTSIAKGSFGQGGQYGSAIECCGNSGGGGGYYGGGASSRGHNGAGGGSGFINSEILTDKHMYCYNCGTSQTAEEYKTTVGTCYNSTATSDCAKAGNGYLKISRVIKSNNNYLRTITTDVGEWETTYSPKINDYIINVDAHTDFVTFFATKYLDNEEVTGLGILELEVGENEHSITVTAEDGSVRTYTFTIVRAGISPSTLLYKIIIDGQSLEMDDEVFEYDVDVSSNKYSFDVKGYPYDKDANVTYSGFGYVKQNKTCYIIVKRTGANPSERVYTINLMKGDIVSEVDFNYTGTIQTYKAPATGYYRLEVWGAQGGVSNGTVFRNYGGYSSGLVYLEGGEILYVVVGGQGSKYANGSSTSPGGYNGGGTGGYGNQGGSGGGGATHIARVSGLLKNLSNQRSDILIVAGAGGGSSGEAVYYKGSGGGYRGVDGGYTTTWPQYYARGSSQTSGANDNAEGGPMSTFGQGGNYFTKYGGNGGGGGWYGGGGASRSHSGGGGGSGYINNEDLESLGDYTKHMTCYNCATSNDIGTLTKTTTKVSSTATSDYAKSGNGAARITYINFSNDNYLKSLLGTDITDKDNPTVLLNEVSDVDFIAEEFTLNVDSTVTQFRVESKPNDSTATIEGNGVYTIRPGDNVITIKVTAENREIRNYVITVHREADTNIYPDNIEINGLVQSICNTDESYCKLQDISQNNITFDKETNTYYMTVPSRIKQIKYVVEKGHEFQKVTGDGIVSLTDSSTGITATTIDVMSEYCFVNELTTSDCYSHYTFNITRDTASDTDIKNMFVDNGENSHFTIDPVSDKDYTIEFHYNNPDVYDYYFSVPNSWDYLKYLYIEKDDENQVITITGNDPGDFSEAGKNYLVSIEVLAPNKVDRATYRLHVYRELNSNIFLSKMDYYDSDNVLYNLNHDFVKSLFDYNLNIPFSIDSLRYDISPDVNTTSYSITLNGNSVSGTTITGINTGDNVITISTTSQIGATGLYTVNLFRAYNNDSDLTHIDVSTDDHSWGIDSEDFDKDTLEYELTVDEGVSSVTITPTLSDNITGKATYKLLDNNTIVVGNNLKRILVTAEDGTYKTYTVNIIRPASSDNSLTSLTVIGSDDITYGVTLEDDIYEYSIDVPNDVKFVTVDGVKSSYLASTTGFGKYYLNTGSNSIIVGVLSESGVSLSYNITINRAYNSDATIATLSSSSGTLNKEFDPNDNNYIINVPYTVKSLNLTYSPTFNTTSVKAYDNDDNELTSKLYNNTYTLPLNLVTGDNKIKLITLAEDETTTLTYNVTIKKAASNDTTLKTLRIKETGIKNNNGEFSANLIYNIDLIHLIIETNDSTATYSISNEEGLTVNNSNDTVSGMKNDTEDRQYYLVTVTVTAEDGSVAYYPINLTVYYRGGCNTYLSTIKVDKGTLNPKFNKDINYYSVEVDNDVTEINVSATAEESGDIDPIIGLGKYNLGVGVTEINLTVNAIDGETSREYQIDVTRKPSSDATLKTLTIEGVSLDPAFNKNNFEYNVSVDTTYIPFSSIITNHPNATFEILNNEMGTITNVGDTADILIKVTAEDKKTINTYTIHTTKLESNNNYLSSLSILGFESSIDFNKTVTYYTVDIPNEVSTIVINAVPEENTSTVSGDGTQNINTGSNLFNIEVESESGLVRTYTINVNRALSSENRIEYLSVNNGTMSPAFTSDNLNYDVVIPFDQTKLDLSIVLKDSSSTYEIIDNNIQDKTGVVRVKVTSESGVDKVYRLSVNKDVNSVALLKSLSVNSYEFTPDFNSNIFNYNLVVNYETTFLNLSYEPLIEGANVVVSGNSNFIVGTNEVTLTVTALDGTTTNTYKIKVTRNKDVNNYLDYLFNDYLNGDFNEPFNKTTLVYTLTVDTDIESIILYGEKQSSDSTLIIDANNRTLEEALVSDSYLGTFGLTKGNNKIKINITNQGYTRTYIINITRRQSSDKDLLTLVVRGNNKKLTLDPEFNKNTYNYELTVDKETNMIELEGTSSPLSTITGLGDVYLDPGLNTVYVNVIAEDGTSKLYTINVTKEASSENHLIDLVPSSGELDPPFGYETSIYDLVLDSSVNFLSFDVTPEDGNSVVTGNESLVVPDGDSVRTITVTAEDNTPRTYTINVSKKISDDATLSDLSVINYDFVSSPDETIKVDFDSDTLEYYVIIKNDKTTFDINDVLYTKNDEKSKVTYSSTISPDTKSFTEFDVVVTAEDGMTKNIYKIFVKRELGSNSQIKKVEPTAGYIETIFRSDEYAYVWIYPALKNIDPYNLNPTLVDENATYDLSVEDNTVRAVVTSEDGTSVTTYVFTIERDLNKNAYASLIDVYYDTDHLLELDPEFDSETLEYTVHVYEDEDELRVSVTPEEETSYVIYDDNETNTFDVTLDDNKTNVITFNVFAEDDVTNEEYTINVIKDIKRLTLASNIEVIDTNSVCSSSLCTLSPSFSPNTVAYRTSVPYEYEVMNLKTTVDEQQSVKYYIYQGNDLIEIENNNYDLLIGENIIYIKVFDGLGNETKIYRVTITRNKSTNTNLDSLIVSSTEDGTYDLLDKDDKVIAYSNNINEYYITVSNPVDTLTINYLRNDEEQKVKISDYSYLTIGEVNEVSIKITAPDRKTTRTILLHVYREGEFEVFLTDITVSSGIIWNLTPEYKKTITSYVVNVSSGTEIVKVEGAGDSDTIVSDAETRIINTGVNEFSITASKTDNDGEVHTKTYIVNVIRPVASEVYLSSLVTSSTIDGTYTSYKNELGDEITFDKGTTDYYLEVSPGVKNLNINAKPGRDEWNVNIYGNNFATGRNIVSIIVYNEEYTTSRTYQLVVTVKPSEDSSLTGIKVYSIDGEEEETVYGISNEDFIASLDNTYTINVPYDIDKVNIKGTPTIDNSIVIGEGEYYLDYGNNELTIYVEAEDGVHFTIYTINVYRAYDLYLSNITEDNANYNIVEEFDKTNDTYIMNVDNSVKMITFEGIPEEDNVTVSYSIDSGSSQTASVAEEGILYTGVGLNKVLITVTAPDGTYKNYHVNVTREQSDNNYLEYLEFDEGIFREPFNKENQSYSMYILDTYTSLDLTKAQIIPEDETAKYAVSGYAGLSKTAPNIVTVAVTSESGKVRNYTVEVILKPESFFMHYLKSLKLTYTSTNEGTTTTHEATLSPVFAQATRNYTVTVPYSVSSITTNAIPLNDDDDAILSASTESGTSLGDATYPLNFGRNVISIKVTSRLSGSDGSFGMYKVIVYRNKNADASLYLLSVKDHLLSPSFNTNRTSYNIDMDSSESKLDITAVPMDPGATVEIIDNGNFKEGANTITIKVTAADGNTTKNYTITANCTLSDNNYLSSIDVKDQSITPTFVKTNTGVYLANVDENVSNVYITAIKETTDSTMNIITASKTYTNKSSFSMNLNPGNNFVYFAVKSVAGNIRTYTLNVFRSYSTDNYLKELIVSDGVLVPEFDAEVTNYNVILEDDLALLSNVSVIGFKHHNAASVVGNGEYTLNETGTTTVTIKVIAQSGDEREYKVNFIKKEAPSSKLKVLDVHEGELDPEFSNDGYKYYLTVPNEITSLDLTIGTNVIPEDEDATVEITGNENFKVGINIVTIKVTATNGDTKSYLVYVTRSILASNYLSNLYVEDQTIEPEFNADTLYYTLTVGSNVDSVHVFAEKEDPQSTLEINGSVNNDKVINLDYGENKVYFTVTSENGASRTYTLVVTRSDSDEYYLLSLSTDIGTWDKGFNKDDNGPYTITVPVKTSMIIFSGTSSVGSTVEGLDSVQIKNGENTHKIVVTSPSGLKNTYNFTINRPSSNNANAMITSDQGDLTLDGDTYKRSVDDSVSQIIFIVTPEDKDAKVVMDESYALTYGKNEITIKVVAEDGITEKNYSIEIYRYKDIESINYTEDEIILNTGATNTPEYTINPSDTDYKEVTFRSDDETIATVDANGEITGVGNGITYIYVTSSHNEKIYDWIKVNVASTRITSSVYTVWHEGDSENELASVDFSYTIGANDKTQVDQFIDNFDNNRDNLKVFDGETMIEDYSKFVGTGMILKLIINDHIYDELVVVVRGDNGTIEKPGNGIITSTDYATLSSILAGLTLKTPMTSLLYDLNKNKILTVTDLSPLSLFIAGKATFTNLNGL